MVPFLEFFHWEFLTFKNAPPPLYGVGKGKESLMPIHFLKEKLLLFLG